MGIGCAKTRACRRAVECGSQTPDVFAFSREARVTLPTDAPPQRSRKLGVSCTFRARPPFVFMLPRVVSNDDTLKGLLEWSVAIEDDPQKGEPLS